MLDNLSTELSTMSVLSQSHSIKELAAALSKAQGELESAKKNSVNSHYKAKYADLMAVLDACRKQLADNGLSVVQFPGQYNGKEMHLTTRLMHLSGEWIEHTMTIPVTRQDPQGVGSCLTYMRRYSLAAVVGIYQEDDDANKASLEKDEEKPKETKKTQSVNKFQFPEYPGKRLLKSPEPVLSTIPEEEIPSHLTELPPIDNDQALISAIDAYNEPIQKTLPPDMTIIPFGKNKGKSFSQVGAEALAKSVLATRRGIEEKAEWVERVGLKQVKYFIAAAEVWLNQQAEK